MTDTKLVPNTRERWDECPVGMTVAVLPPGIYDAYAARCQSEGVEVPEWIVKAQQMPPEAKPVFPPRPAYVHDLDEWLEEHPLRVIER